MLEQSHEPEYECQPIGVAQPLAPEDVRVGDIVTLTHRIEDVIPAIDAYSAQPVMQPTRIKVQPSCAGWPYEVLSVCIPFVMVEEMDGDIYNLDLRRHMLARLPASYLEAVRQRRSERAAQQQPQTR